MKKMPISRDTRVIGSSPITKPAYSQGKGDEVAKSKSTPCLVTVMGFGNNDVLFRSNNANIVQWRDSDGEIIALLVRIKPEVWGFSRRGDHDWEENLSIYGNKDAV